MRPKKEGLSLKEKEAYTYFVCILSNLPDDDEGTQRMVHEKVAKHMNWENWRSSDRAMRAAIKAHFDPSLLDIKECYDNLAEILDEVGRNLERKQKKA